ncbi:peptidoglycan DD-metalloendopeptidase family protein [Lihuaxuella thermophila]|nr:peptidoglycan DD-metalloendopeptidase family protein [Lihuaxuella thermophila]
MKNRAIACTLAAALLVAGLPFHGASAENVREKVKEIREKKADILDQISQKNAEMQKYEQTIREAQEEVKKIEKQVEPVQLELKKRMDEAEEVNKVFKQRLRFLYQKGEMNYMANVLAADSFNDFLTRFEYARLFIKQDYALFQKRMEKVREVEEQKKKYDQLIAKQQEEIKKAHDAFNKLMEEMKKDKSNLQKIHATEEYYEDELIEINLEEWRSGKLTFPYTGPMIRPAKVRESSGYGYRVHPVTGVGRMHEGIDYAGPVGTPIYAAADGVVVSSRSSSGYGWLITIYHGNKNGKRVFTRYAHSYPYQVKVRVGQQVYAGEQISSIGNNGLSTGPHLHFEVRYGYGDNPPAVNPKSWLR